jgi:zinc protease
MFNQSIIPAALATLSALIPSASWCQDPPPAPERASFHRHENGLTSIVQRSSRTRHAAVLLALRVGSRHDPPGKAGLTHLLEHMLVRGPSDGRPAGEAERLLARNGPTRMPGMDCNAETLPDFLYVYALTKPEGIGDALAVLAGQMRSLKIEEAVLREERERALGEVRTVQSSVPAVLYHTTLATAYARHPYRYPKVGLAEGLQAVTVDDLRAHYVRYCRPDNAIVIVYGNVEPADGLAQIKSRFGTLPATPALPAPAVKGAESEPEQTAQRRVKLSLHTEGPEVMIAWRSAPPGVVEKAALQVLAAHLQQSLSQRLVASGTAAFVSVQDDLYAVQGGLFLIHAVAAAGKAAGELEKRILQAVTEVREGGVPEAALAPLRLHLAAGLRLLDPDLDPALRAAPDPAMTLVQMAITRARLEVGLAPWHARLLAELPALAPETIRATAGIYLREERANVVTLEPR